MLQTLQLCKLKGTLVEDVLPEVLQLDLSPYCYTDPFQLRSVRLGLQSGCSVARVPVSACFTRASDPL